MNEARSIPHPTSSRSDARGALPGSDAPASLTTSDPAPEPRRLNLALVSGLAALALLWPLAELTGVPRGIGRAVAILSIIAVCWIGVVGFGRFARPVLTLTLAGLGAGVLSHAFAYAFGGGAPIWALPISLALQAGWGALAGVVAWGIQALLGGAGR